MPAALSTESILASSLIADEDIDNVVDAVLNGKDVRKAGQARVGIGVKSVDEALMGGLEKGNLVGVSAEVGGGGLDLCLSLLVNSLLDHPTENAAVIDSTGNLDVLRIYSVVYSRLSSDASLLESHRTGLSASATDATVEDVAAKALDRVNIMRVFDLVGITEAIEEIRNELEAKPKERVPLAELPVVEQEPATEQKRTEIADSEDEEDEMLFDSEISALSKPPIAVAPLVPPLETQPLHNPQADMGSQNAAIERKTSLILIDNLSHVLSPLLKKDYAQANSLLTALLRTLVHLSTTHLLLTILLNPSPTTRQPKPPPTTPSAPKPQLENIQQLPPSPSIFASNVLIPALGNILPMYLDIHLLVSKIPRRKADAGAMYAGSGRGGARRGVEMVDVIEVLASRWDGRGGRWGAFVVRSEGGVRDA